ncbi:hypothetical protein HK097_009516 [Rhizophlyctis rosea]|uniref:Ankyrin n=1 Tax=Rhizophlyctis rosea TaxID=64517 RepID=A0AAD5X121_9FUNG|nr:hypothetical protein HK097_009516 [Rhizophlyctis rosea]
MPPVPETKDRWSRSLGFMKPSSRRSSASDVLPQGPVVRPSRPTRRSGSEPTKQLGLHAACSDGDIGLAKYALDNGQAVDSLVQGLQPIHFAAMNGDAGVIRLLIRYGADPNVRQLTSAPLSPTIPTSPRRRSNLTPPQSPTLRSTTPTPFSSSSSITSSSSIASPPSEHSEFQLTGGPTPLHFAAASGHASAVKTLLDCSADPSLRDEFGCAPADLAAVRAHREVVELLLTRQRLVEEQRERERRQSKMSTSSSGSTTSSSSSPRSAGVRSSMDIAAGRSSISSDDGRRSSFMEKRAAAANRVRNMKGFRLSIDGWASAMGGVPPAAI